VPDEPPRCPRVGAALTEPGAAEELKPAPDTFGASRKLHVNDPQGLTTRVSVPIAAASVDRNSHPIYAINTGNKECERSSLCLSAGSEYG